MNRNRWAPLAAAAAVIAVLVGISLVSSDGRGSGPPLLRLAAAEGSFTAAAADGRGSYTLMGILPSGPSEARVRDLPRSAADVAQVRRLATALGETAAPARIKGAWRAGDLLASDEPGNPWRWGAGCGPDTPGSSEGSGASDLPLIICDGSTISSGTVYPCPENVKSCSTPSTGGSSTGGSSGSRSTGTPTDGCTTTKAGSTECSGSAPAVDPQSPRVSCMPVGCTKPTVGTCAPPPPGAEPVTCDDPGIPLPQPIPEPKVLLSESQVLAATSKIREALGLAGAPTRVEGLNVIVEPLADGLPTNAMTTMLQLSSQAKLISANGMLSTGHEGDLYPLRTARKALDNLPIVAMGMPCSAAGCPEGPAITGARLGLSRVTLDKGAALVPAWLFAVKGSPVPLVALAVADEFLGGPDPVKTDPGTEPRTTEPGIGDPGSKPKITEPGPDRPIAPPPGSSVKPPVSAGREPFSFDGAYADADPEVLVVRYGDSGSCPSQAVRHEVVEQSDRVFVTLTRTPMPADQACTMDYRAVLVRVTLAAPLGGREVVDVSRKEPVPISTGTPPLG